MAEEGFKRKLTAIFSADVVGYSRLMGEDERGTVSRLKEYRQVMASSIQECGGRVVDAPGDNILAEFASVVDALKCAVEVQKELRSQNDTLPPEKKMEFRIGVNLGDVIEDGKRIYGDGVNVAARIEGLAESGGVCISGTAYDQIGKKLPFGYEFLGEQSVKNIEKPIRVYRVLTDPDAVGKVIGEKRFLGRISRRAAIAAVVVLIIIAGGLIGWNLYLHQSRKVEAADPEKMAFPLPDRPSIAVLPFTNMSGDPEQEYIGDGLTENIISALSVSSEIFVIAGNSTFIYKGKPVKVQQVSEDLGVQYVLEGSIQKSGDRLRVTAQLIDALKGYHILSKKYDREMKELFQLQDEITKKITRSILAKLLPIGEDALIFETSTNNFEALSHFVKGNGLFVKYNEGDNIKAKEHYKAALKLDPEYVEALVNLGWTHLVDIEKRWSYSPSMSLNSAFELAQKALKINTQDARAHTLLGAIYRYQRQYENAISSGKNAITISPNYALGYDHLGRTMFYAGQFDEAVKLFKKALRLNPNLPKLDLSGLRYLLRSYVQIGRNEEALEVSNQIKDLALGGRYPRWIYLLGRAYVYQNLGKEDESRACIGEALKLNPYLSLKMLNDPLFKNPEHLQRELDAFRKAGLPE